MKLLLRYLLKELLTPLVVWVTFLFLLLFVMQFLRGTDVLLGSAVSGDDLMLVILYLSPHFLVMALPIAFLLAILLGIGRLSEDRELLALNALGIGPLQILLTPITVGIFLGGLMMLLSFSLEPWGLSAVKGVVNEVIKKNVIGDVRPGVFYEELTDLTVYAEQVDPVGRVWTNVLIHDDRDPAMPLLVLAKEGRVNPSGSGQALKLALLDGTLHRGDRDSIDYSLIAFERGELAVGVEESISRKNRFRRPKEELTPAELLAAADQADQEGGDGRSFRMAYHWRLGQVFTPLAFALLGTPLAMNRKNSRARGYLLTLLGYVAYYVLSRFFENLGAQDRMPLVVAGQLPNVLFAAVGCLVLYRVSRAGTVR